MGGVWVFSRQRDVHRTLWITAGVEVRPRKFTINTWSRFSLSGSAFQHPSGQHPLVATRLRTVRGASSGGGLSVRPNGFARLTSADLVGCSAFSQNLKALGVGPKIVVCADCGGANLALAMAIHLNRKGDGAACADVQERVAGAEVKPTSAWLANPDGTKLCDVVTAEDHNAHWHFNVTPLMPVKKSKFVLPQHNAFFICLLQKLHCLHGSVSLSLPWFPCAFQISFCLSL